MRVTIIYGTDGGNTRRIAEQIASQINGKVVEVSAARKTDFEDCDLLILGAPTCGYGDLQSDWDSRLSILTEVNLSGKQIALFGLGDQITYADTFSDALGVLYEELTKLNVEIVGFTSTEGYVFYSSRAVREDRFVGLVLDEDIQPDRTEERITTWLTSLTEREPGFALRDGHQ